MWYHKPKAVTRRRVSRLGYWFTYNDDAVKMSATTIQIQNFPKNLYIRHRKREYVTEFYLRYLLDIGGNKFLTLKSSDLHLKEFDRSWTWKIEFAVEFCKL